MAKKDDGPKHFGTIIGSTFAVLIVVMMLSMTLVAANKETYYSAYVTEASDEKSQLAQVTDMRDGLGNDEGYKMVEYKMMKDTK